MKVYEPLVTKGYEWVNCCDDADYEVFLAWDGSPQGERWNPVKVRRVRADERQEFNPSDFPWLGAHALVMRKRAVDALSAILDPYGELLPLASGDEVELFVFNARAVDALDEERSTIIRFPGTSRIIRLTKVAFAEAAIRDVEIFRLPHRTSPTYVSQRFVDRVEDAELIGLQFKRVWTSTRR
ncbi:imm11 family protein [Haliangium sp.]|uniref:imm11 family protein n=1 Tax=Haliangium sp. TaxID=2663208 RepID=UPI003D0F7A78